MSVYDNFNSSLVGKVVQNYAVSFDGKDGKKVEYNEVVLFVDNSLVVVRSTVEEVKDWKVDQVVKFRASLAGRANVRLARLKLTEVEPDVG